MRRRTALKALASASVGVSVGGCLGGEQADVPETTANATPKQTETPDDCPPKDQPVPTCGDEWERVNAYTDGDVRAETGTGFELTVEPTTLALGDCVTFRLTNRSDEERMTGIEEKYDVHRETSDGWQSILFTTQRAYYDLGVEQKPGEGFVWRRRLSRAGLSVDDATPPVRVCEPLRPGTYRFVYWGVGDGVDGLGVEFEITE